MHRDIKPANLLVGPDLSIKLCDFGFSRCTPQKASAVGKAKSSKNGFAERRLTKHVCTRYYRPPEVILLEKDYNTQVDVWGVGCILTELLVCSREYKSMIEDESTRILFKGDSCYPMSPIVAKEDQTVKVGKSDQLR
eukprot:CAMPEP_0170483248 /NCGR_PEP_ID=MMETSP0208-20121228/2951_1 /TAXON_ID=197538 /ORGANISM="Strombidium inclinatum, Strain S3" /LENGTH=136 /DNA_ID=CAMNT_0010756207 /DNA_START=522 /DNA_END=932 /DNA_ORIENTATION=-